MNEYRLMELGVEVLRHVREAKGMPIGYDGMAELLGVERPLAPLIMGYAAAKYPEVRIIWNGKTGEYEVRGRT